ncbi:hypothetical protein LSTR_LSTR011791 [Laodelphax striatellus]|uniref:Uncharacterized protein n=1 Tax=Laodelphax striatellus TaxID=195883 RepID=A0A482WRE6_LAOST|nr:hypothetical protein LSTR_LSTR011791 [Laodelphax striatellus]
MFGVETYLACNVELTLCGRYQKSLPEEERFRDSIEILNRQRPAVDNYLSTRRILRANATKDVLE